MAAYRSLSHREMLNRATGKGHSSRFFPLDNGRGVKFFRSERVRDDVMGRQKRAAMFGFAPKAYGIVHDMEHIGWYGFETELAVMSQDFDSPVSAGSTEYWQKADALRERVEEVLGIHLWDNEPKNVGFIGDRMVIVDWGSEGIYSDPLVEGETPYEQGLACAWQNDDVEKYSPW